jgi:pilus assembly protein TadC
MTWQLAFQVLVIVVFFGTFLLCILNAILGFSKLAMLRSLRDELRSTNQLSRELAEFIRQYFEMFVRESRESTATVHDAAKSVAAVTDDQNVKIDSIAKTTDQVHTLVNSQRTSTQRALAVALRIIATDRPSAENEAKAVEAEAKADDYERREARLDAGGDSSKSPPETPPC